MEGNPYRGKTIGHMLDAAAARFGGREAIVFADERLTYAELRGRVDRLARGLLALGVDKGDPVALWLPNRPIWPVTQYACAKIGAPVVALNTRYRAHELSYILEQSDATTLLLTDHLAHTDFLEILQDVLPELSVAEPGAFEADKFPRLKRIIVDAEDPYPGTLRLEDVLEAGDESEWECGLQAAQSRVQADDVFTLLYTSGTTSCPKGAMISQANCLPHGWNCGVRLRMTADDRVLHTLPFSGTWGGLNIPLTTFTHGACLVLLETFDPGPALYLMAKERITVWNAVDAMVRSVLEHRDLDRSERSSLRTGGIALTGGSAQSLFDEAVNRLGLRQAYQPYGMTEINALALSHDLDEPLESRRLPGVWPAPDLEVRVANPDTGEPVKAGEEGELWFRGELVTRGYYKKPEETTSAFTEDGWFRSGDLGVRDGVGRTIFRGRLREVLRISHFMVAPKEIEEFLMAHPKVRQAFVVGVPDPRLGEAPVAYVIPKDSAHLSEAELRAHCQGKIASFKIPRVFRLVQDVPRAPGPHGDKVQKAQLRELAIQDLGLQ